MKKILPMIALAAFAAGCQSYQYNKGGDAYLRPTIVRDVAYEKFDISNKPIEVSVHATYIFGIARLGSSYDKFAEDIDKQNGFLGTPAIAEVRNQAYVMACMESKCDSIVGAQYEIKQENYLLWKNITVTLKGYPAKLIGVEFRPATFNK